MITDYALRIQQLNEEGVHKALEKYQSRLKQLMGETEFNFWMEVEADLVGLRYYLRAGFDPNSLINLWVNREVRASKITGVKCSYKLDSPPNILYSKELRDQLLLGQTHPTHCWRAWRLAKEIEYLKEEGWVFGKVVNFYENGNRLKMVKEEEKGQ